MTLSEYLANQDRGAKACLAAAICAHASDLSDWLAGRRPIPAHYCPGIERETGGAVTRQELRPNDWQRYWPELAEHEAQEASHG